ncbi:hypothetical protein VCRA2119O147_90061 [Vibrio crassostreae]|uniref:Uncharacterized protein n=1 Tax=Vibrio crassostreae TaxID=246167 RepID=A0A822MY76_9VIBR|nr:hypothetical protein VCRA2112O187_1390008 [Vibrio crassostreae]CAK1852355.1 hypothetical protein VCRA2113O20_10151 [Vibrio crassostreae]CAK1864937.1 hypothetical protein VCRA2119O47_10274 [Vibrio crassostreae]CAK1866569.1 hypothetical protein VCRA2116O30_10151 [Vibrio crassostreae]CAK1866856.1 hypothetical protein VCRA2119O44_10274 [Vibrio crassostreae]
MNTQPYCFKTRKKGAYKLSFKFHPMHMIQQFYDRTSVTYFTRALPEARYS